MSLLKPTLNAEFFSKQYYDRAMKECPKLSNLFGEPTNDYMLTVLSFNLSYNAFYRGKRQTAIKLLQTVFNSTKVDNQIYRAASLLEAQICIELNNVRLAQQLLQQLVKHPSWRGATSEHTECFELLMARCRGRTASSSVNSIETTNALHWFLIDCESQLKSGDLRSGLNALLKRRIGSVGDERRLLDNAIGCVFGYHSKDCNMAESYFRNAMLKHDYTTDSSLTVPILSSTLVYHTALAQLGSGKPRSAAHLFAAVLPFFAENPRVWLRIAECCVHGRSSEPLPIEADVLGKYALDGWQTAKWAMRDKSDDLPATFICNAEFGVVAIRQGLKLALAHNDYAYLLPYFYSLSAYVNIRLRHYEDAIRATDELLALPQINLRQKLMGLFYKAEALVYAKRRDEAVETLKLAVPLQSINYTFPRIVYNRALFEAIDGRCERSFEVLGELNNAGQAMMHRGEPNLLRVYLDMQLRRMQFAKQIFKQSSALNVTST